MTIDLLQIRFLVVVVVTNNRNNIILNHFFRLVEENNLHRHQNIDHRLLLRNHLLHHGHLETTADVSRLLHPTEQPPRRLSGQLHSRLQ